MMNHADFNKHMQISDGGLTSGISMTPVTQQSMDHFENVLNLNMVTDYHYNPEYWTTAYKNGSTPMKEMEGRLLTGFKSFIDHSENFNMIHLFCEILQNFGSPESLS